MEVESFSFVILFLFSIIAGFIDAVAGGGGLIQLPALLIQLPNQPITHILGTNKMAAFSGTIFSAINYSKRVTFNFYLIVPMAIVTAIASYLGAKTVHLVDIDVLKPVVLVILVLIFIYTLAKKDVGSSKNQNISKLKMWFSGIVMSILIGFYDGFFGPGTGSFFILGFVIFLGFEFLQASAYAKILNSLTNLSAIYVFALSGHFIGVLALIMAFGNILGSVIGTKMALKKGNRFIRILYLTVVSTLIGKYAWDIFIK